MISLGLFFCMFCNFALGCVLAELENSRIWQHFFASVIVVGLIGLGFGGFVYGAGYIEGKFLTFWLPLLTQSLLCFIPAFLLAGMLYGADGRQARIVAIHACAGWLPSGAFLEWALGGAQYPAV